MRFPFRISIPAERSARLPLSLALLGAASLLASSAASAQTVGFAGPGTSVNFGNVNLCKPGASAPAPCSETLTLTYNVTESGTLGAPQVVTAGAPNLDFTLAPGSTCVGAVAAGTTCTVNAKFTPLYAGSRPGGVLIESASGTVLATTLIYGFGNGPQIGFNSGVGTYFPGFFSYSPYLALYSDGAGDLFESPATELPAGSTSEAYVPLPGLRPGAVFAADGAGDLFASTTADGTMEEQILELPAGGGSQIILPISIGVGPPPAIATDAAGDLFFVAPSSSGLSTVKERKADGTLVTLPVSGLSNAIGLAVDPFGDVFIAASVQAGTPPAAANGVVELKPDGTQVTLAKGLQCYTYECGLAVDAVGNVYVPTTAGYGVAEYPAGGGAPTTLATSPNPGSIAVNPAADIYFQLGDLPHGYGPVSDTGTMQVVKRSAAAPLNFGATPIGTQKTLPLQITNTGTETLTVNPSISGAGFSILGAEPENCLHGITATETCTLQIQFSPLTQTSVTGVLTLATNGPADSSVQLEAGGAELAAPVFSLPSGVYGSPQTVSITDAVPGAFLYYTTDGKDFPTYTGPISVTSTERITAYAFLGSVNAPSATAAYTIAPSTPADSINLSQGFAGTSAIQFNGGAQLDGTRLQLTRGHVGEAPGSAFYSTPMNVQSFSTDFTFQLTNPVADGITFAIQNVGPTALGEAGDGLGYEGIGQSVAVKFDLLSNAGEGPDSTGLYVDGAIPTVPAVSLAGSGIDLHSQDPILAQITYNGTKLILTLTDTLTLATWSHSFAVNIPAVVGGNTAYLGFTGATGNQAADQEILNWTYISGAPGTPAPPPFAAPIHPTYPGGFNSVGMTLNGTAAITGGALRLTDGGLNEAGSAFYSIPVRVQSFHSNFTFQLSAPNPSVPLADIADGITYTIQNESPTALGDYGGALGYAPIGESVAIKFDLHNNAGEGPNSFGVYVDGAMPTIDGAPPNFAYYDLTNSGIDLHSGHPFDVEIDFIDGYVVDFTITDTITKYSFGHFYLTANIPTIVGGIKAYIGFTGSTGSKGAVQDILNWSYTTP
jgi:hypothetical protein